MQSATKSVTSMVFGVARDQGLIPSFDLTVEQLFPDKHEGLDALKRTITLHHMLTMTSGLEFDNGDFALEMLVDRPEDPLRYILDKPLYAAPGAEYYYRDADPQLVGYAVQRLTGRTEQDLAAAHLFGPLGITDYYWELEPDGVAAAAHALHLRPRDLAKLGQLMLDEGQWRGTRIVSQEWVRLSTSPQVQSTTNDRSGRPYDCGYYWWLVRDAGYAAWGHGGQFVFVVPAKRMVIVQIALPDAELHGSSLNDFLELVEPLIAPAQGSGP